MKNNMSPANSKKIGIYIHIPFCVQKCKYCDFCSFPIANENVKLSYKNALIKNIKSVSKHFEDREVDSIFFGGGTPTCLNPKELCEILNSVYSNYSVSKDTEITLECNPATAAKEDFEIMIKGGFNRLSLGLQSANDMELSSLGRIHTFEEFKSTYNDARLAGFENINVDLMYGIPKQTEASFLSTLNRVLELNPEHISAYSLKIEPNTEFFKNKENLILPSEDAEYNMYKSADRILTSNGFLHYEISNYSLEGRKSRHNLKYWSCDEYLGFGVASHSFINQTRYSNTSSINEYIDSIENDKIYYSVEEILSTDELIEEYIMMRLRLCDGLSLKAFEDKFSKKIDNKYISRMNPFIKSGHIICTDDKFSLSAEGMYVSNYILTEILDLGL